MVLCVALLAAAAVATTAGAMAKSSLRAEKVKRKAYAMAYSNHGHYVVVGNNNDDDENDGASWYDRAHSYYQRGSYEKAGRAYDNAAKFGYNRATAYYNAGCSWALAKQPDPALKSLQASFDEGFDDLDMYASDEDLNSLREDPRFKTLLTKVQNTDEAAQERRAAGRDYDRLSTSKDVDEGDWNSVGIDLMRAGDYDKAALAFDNEFKLGRNEDEDAIYNKACARALQGKPDEALKLLDQAIATGSVSSDHMAEDSDLSSLHKNKKFDALVDLAEDLELNYPGFAVNSWNINGVHVKHNGDYDDEKHWNKSLQHFKDMAAKHPTYARAWFNLGYAQLKSGDAASCTPNFQKAFDMGFKPSTMMYNLACSTAQEGKIDTAFAWLDKSEKAGFHVGGSARWDEDLDPLRADPRWRELKKKWRDQDEKQAEAHGVKINSNDYD